MCFASWPGFTELYITTVTLPLTNQQQLQTVAMHSRRPRPGKLQQIQFFKGLSSFGLENDRISTNVFYNSRD